jgi:hypothetical protein
MTHLESAQKVLIAKLANTLKQFADYPADQDYICHKGIVPMTQCARCGPILNARKVYEEARDFLMGFTQGHEELPAVQDRGSV